ncbi:DUF3526 domain-containing protein [Siphonobacter sp. SORGH_AS_1065]|uniref:ABC transporter permease n=1 Tax=Siphonobacter sp. SORGH_AS_1065 TaxID=3041795 RepID=UPI00277FCEFC|nr:DUF3526 domain-containing protein [Siphonobacter sp. SORGH_AS_1065]MDQ1089789.1 ABC-2 type transport system permease protein [Siphonobacter sp. SORGH_AS_1065]
MQLHFIKIIARQEWNTVFRSRTTRLLYFSLLAVSLLATITGWQYVSKFNRQQAVAHQQVHDHWMSQPDRHPHRVAHYGYLVFREKSPLSFFDFGLDSYVGNAVFLEAHRQNTINLSEASFSNGMLRFGELSLALVIQLLVPLLIVFIGFSTIAGLKQNGVLKILLCQRASFFDLLVGKTAGLTAAVWALFLPLILISLVAGSFFLSDDGLGIDSLLRIAIIVSLYAIYFLIVGVLVVGVSAVSTSAKNALMVLVSGWILSVVVIPKSAQTLGSKLHEAPNKIAFEQAIEAELSQQGDSHDPNDPHFAQLKASLLQKYGVDSVQALPLNYGALVMQESETISSALFSKHFDRLIGIYQSQNAVSSALAFVDPFLAIRNLSMNLCGTDFNSFTAFQQQTEHYRYQKSQRLNQIHLTQIRYKNDGQQKVSAKNWQQMPDFTFQPITITESLSTAGVSLAALTCWVLAGFGALYYISSKRNYLL